MRLRLALRGYSFKYTIYEWASQNWTQVFLDNRYTLQSEAQIYDSDTVVHKSPGSSGTDELVHTDKFLYPLILKPIMVLDGTIFGNLRYLIYITTGTGSFTFTKIEIKLKSVDSSNNETDLTDVFTINCNWAATTTQTTKDYPFFLSIHNKKVATNERLILETKLYATWNLTDIGAYIDRWCDKNTDHHSIEIPIV